MRSFGSVFQQVQGEVTRFIEQGGGSATTLNPQGRAYLEHTKLAPQMKVKAMSKGMIVQLHLALVMAIDAKLLVLDEPTLGLDILYRKQFYRICWRIILTSTKPSSSPPTRSRKSSTSSPT